MTAKKVRDVQSDLQLYVNASRDDKAYDRLVLIRINGVDHVLTSVELDSDGILGEYIVLNADPISTIL